MQRRGFNLVECLIACSLISAMSIALFGVWEMHSKGAATSRDYIVGSALAEQEMENCLSRGYTVANDSADYGVNHTVENVSLVRTYHVKAEVFPIYTWPDSGLPAPPPAPSTITSGLKIVNVTVYWEDPWSSSGNHSVHLTTTLSWEG